jgi:hypothetical protein
MNVDYIIVGCGLAGIHFCEQLRAHQKSFVVFDDLSQKSSVVASGLYNPVVLKRFTSVWNSEEQLALALPVYATLEKSLNVKLDYNIPVLRRFTSIEEQNNWFTVSDKPELSQFLSADIIKNNNLAIDAPFGFGKVLQTGRIDTNLLISEYKSRLKQNNLLFEDVFDYSALNANNEVSYKDISANHIVFAEGFGLKKNPFFNHLPMREVKGELLTIYAPKLKIDYVLKSSVFIIPLGNDLYRIGATYDWKDKSNDITSKAKKELLNKLKTFIKCDFDVISQVAGIRPTVNDRRPLVGQHELHKNFYVLNGLCTRGVMIAPYIAKELYRFIEHDIPLDNAIDINRF